MGFFHGPFLFSRKEFPKIFTDTHIYYHACNFNDISRRRLGFHGHFSRFFYGDLSSSTDRSLKIFTQKKKSREKKHCSRCMEYHGTRQLRSRGRGWFLKKSRKTRAWKPRQKSVASLRSAVSRSCSRSSSNTAFWGMVHTNRVWQWDSTPPTAPRRKSLSQRFRKRGLETRSWKMHKFAQEYWGRVEVKRTVKVKS